MLYTYDSSAMLAETEGLSLLEQGVYRVLMDIYTNNNGLDLPDAKAGLTEGNNLNYLASLIGGKTESELRATAKVVMSFFVRSGSHLHHPRLQHLLESPQVANEPTVLRVSVFYNATESNPLAIPFGLTDSIQWWAPTEEDLRDMEHTYRLCDLESEIRTARKAAIHPSARPRENPNVFLQQRLEASNRQIGDRLESAGVSHLSRESQSFVRFVVSYPKQTDMLAAWHVWNIVGADDNPALFDQLMKGLARWKVSEEWLQCGGLAVPSPAQFLREGLWEVSPRLDAAAAVKIAAATVAFDSSGEET